MSRSPEEVPCRDTANRPGELDRTVLQEHRSELSLKVPGPLNELRRGPLDQGSEFVVITEPVGPKNRMGGRRDLCLHGCPLGSESLVAIVYRRGPPFRISLLGPLADFFQAARGSMFLGPGGNRLLRGDCQGEDG